jgi:hypothetical protein
MEQNTNVYLYPTNANTLGLVIQTPTEGSTTGEGTTLATTTEEEEEQQAKKKNKSMRSLSPPKECSGLWKVCLAGYMLQQVIVVFLGRYSFLMGI